MIINHKCSIQKHNTEKDRMGSLTEAVLIIGNQTYFEYRGIIGRPKTEMLIVQGTDRLLEDLGLRHTLLYLLLLC